MQEQLRRDEEEREREKGYDEIELEDRVWCVNPIQEGQRILVIH